VGSGQDNGDEGEGPGRADDQDDNDEIPPAPLRAMVTRMHSRRRTEPGDDGHVHRQLGSGDATISVIDDGPDHCMIGRRVGHASDGTVYCLVGRISLERYTDIVAGDLDLLDVFSEARDVALCGVFDDEHGASNVFVVRRYTHPEDVPDDYLPPGEFIEFLDDSDDSDDPDDPENPDES